MSREARARFWVEGASRVERWAKIEALFHAVVVLPEGERAAWLDRHCAGAPDIRRDVEALLAIESGAPPTAASLAIAPDSDLDHERIDMLVGSRIGAYRILERIAEGGMGVIYLAERDDAQFEKRVAIKVLRSGLYGEDARARFRDERRILATLEHPDIVRLLDAGETAGGVLYLVMEYCPGTPITEFCESRSLNIRARIELFARVCDAVEHAHRSLLVHRDITPSNIIVGENGAPKLLDFGIAKLLADAQQGAPSREARTATGSHLFTLDYASPEQIRGDRLSTATDVYSLGAVLYELLTGVPAHGQDATARLALLASADPPRPSSVAPRSLRRTLSADLDWIVMRALDREPSQRYTSVAHFAEDLRRWLAGEPVLARRGTFTYRATKMIRRHKAGMVAALSISAALIAATAVSLDETRRADQHARMAELRAAEVRSAANVLLFELDEQLRTLPGTTQARQAIVGRALAYLKSLSVDVADDPALYAELAAAYAKVGDIQGSPRMPNLGQPVEAIESFRTAIGMLRRVEQLDTRSRLILARALCDVGQLEYLDRARPSEGRAMFRECIAEASAALSAAGSEARAIIVHGNCLLAFCEQEIDLDLDSAKHDAAACRREALAWAAADPSETAKYHLAYARETLGLVAIASGDLEEGRRELMEALAILEPLVAEANVNALYLRELGYAYMQLARVSCCESLSFDDPLAAEEWAGKAIGVLEDLRRRDPSDQRATMELALVVSRLASALSRRDPQKALETYERARALHAASNTADSAQASEIADSARFDAIEPLLRLGRHEEAAKIVEQSAARAKDPEADAISLYALSKLEVAARVHLARGRLDAAETAVLQAIAIAEQLVARHPRHAAQRLELGNAHRTRSMIEKARLENTQLGAAARDRARQVYCEASSKALAAWGEPPANAERPTYAMRARVELERELAATRLCR